MTDTIYYYNMSSSYDNFNYNMSNWNASGSNIHPKNFGGYVGVNTSTPTQTFNSVGSFNMTTGDGGRAIYTNATCVIIEGPTSMFSIC
jgi:hypothetical protein